MSPSLGKNRSTKKLKMSARKKATSGAPQMIGKYMGKKLAKILSNVAKICVFVYG